MLRMPNGLRLPLIAAGLLLIVLGYTVMAVSPETNLDIVVRRVFMGVGMTTVGGLLVVIVLIWK